MMGKHGRFIEASEHQTTPIPFPDDDMFALSILLNVAHLQFSRIPVVVTLEQLYQIAVTFDKYDAGRVALPWLHRWFEEAKTCTKLTDFPSQWSFISWAFGDERTFRTTVEFLLENIKKLQKGELLICGRNFVDKGMPLDLFGKSLNAFFTMVY